MKQRKLLRQKILIHPPMLSLINSQQWFSQERSCYLYFSLSNEESGFITTCSILGQQYFIPIPQRGFYKKVSGVLFNKHHFYGAAVLTKKLIIFYTVCFSPLCCFSFFTAGCSIKVRETSFRFGANMPWFSSWLWLCSMSCCWYPHNQYILWITWLSRF